MKEGGFLMEANRRTTSQNKGKEGGQKNGTGAFTLVEGGRVLNGGQKKDLQNKGEAGGQKYGTGALTLVEGGFLMEVHRKNTRTKVSREVRRMEQELST